MHRMMGVQGTPVSVWHKPVKPDPIPSSTGDNCQYRQLLQAIERGDVGGVKT